ncbi:hypothetical protein Moror_5134 [Moniliophthora roreri MCA 2997]|uniref:Uncharacterized protein n=2 Tax=Moniliophthora roreri TaxID=221103 RepID=V2YC39_MONRO|nr:hypothetical protein Moror_5134 [Moniliophthora roreri MCA 2997]
MDSNLDSGNLRLPVETVAIPHLVGSCISFGTMGMFVWDILINLSSEYHLLLRRKIGLLTLIYYWARIITLVLLIMTAVFFIAPLGRHCSTISTVILSLLPTFITAECILLFWRLRAIYLDQGRVVIVFLTCSFLVVSFSVLTPFAGRGFPASPTNSYCTASLNVPLAQALVIVPLVYTIFVFIAISYKLMPPKFDEQDPNQHTSRNFWAFWRTKDLPLLSKTLLQDGQMYILIFIITTLMSVMPMTVKSVPVIYKFIFVVPHIAIENAMNSYLFRSVRATMLLQNQLAVDATLYFASNLEDGGTQGSTTSTPEPV